MTAPATVPIAGDRHVPWMKLLPTNWQFKPLKYLCQINARSLPEDSPAEQTIKYIDIGNVDSDGKVGEVVEVVFGEAPSRARRILASGDVFISTVRTYLTAIAYADAKLDGHICSTGFAVLTPGAVVEPRFLYYWTRLTFFVSEIVARSTGVSYPAINATEIGQLPFPVLARSEQHTIAAFLDRKTAEVDAVVAKKERMIELLRSERQALISLAVTQGLDASVTMKVSGVPWLGAVPNHWQIERLKFRMLKIEQGWSPQCENQQADVGEWGVLKVGCMNSGVYDETENKALPSTLEAPPELEVRIGDVLMSRSNTVALVGMVGIVHRTQGKILVCDKLYRIAFDTARLQPEHAVHLLRSHAARLQIERDASGASPSMKNISNEVVGNLVLGFPPIHEQRRICAHIEKETGRIDGLIEKNEQQIAKLREYRQTLISAAVTGKIAVTPEPVVVPPGLEEGKT